MLKYLLMIVGAICFFYAASVVLFYFNQDSLLFQPEPISESDATAISSEKENREEITIEVDRDTYLHGWISRSEQHENSDSPSPLFIYFGGNAEEVSQSIDQFDHLDGWTRAFINYRGYGLSDGSPSEENLFHDATVIYDVLTARDDIDEDKVVVIGRSMGTASAVHLSQERDVSGTILVSPYDTRTRLSEHRHRFMPVQTLIRHPFEISDKATEISSPLLTITGSNDLVIPPSHSRVTTERWKGEAEKVSLDGYGHNDLQQSSEYWKNIDSFLNEILNQD